MIKKIRPNQENKRRVKHLKRNATKRKRTKLKMTKKIIRLKNLIISNTKRRMSNKTKRFCQQKLKKRKNKATKSLMFNKILTKFHINKRQNTRGSYTCSKCLRQRMPSFAIVRRKSLHRKRSSYFQMESIQASSQIITINNLSRINSLQGRIQLKSSVSMRSQYSISFQNSWVRSQACPISLAA